MLLDIYNENTLFMAASVPTVRTLGPGNRFALWLQGCPFHCPGCLSPEFSPMLPFNPMSPSSLAAQIVSVKGLEGVTISGGEPLIQSAALSRLTLMLKQTTGLSIILYTGYTMDELSRLMDNRPAIRTVLENIDVLIDGRYDHSLNDDTGLRGSSNQKAHFLTPRYAHLKELFSSNRRKMEFHDLPDGKMMVGLPTVEQWRAVNLDERERTWYDQFEK